MNRFEIEARLKENRRMPEPARAVARQAPPEVYLMKHPTREAWLNAAVKALLPLFGKRKHPKKLRVSPAGRHRAQLSGSAWHEAQSADNSIEIFIAPDIADKVEVLDILTHELVHAILGEGHGHGPTFRALALHVGLTGKMTATVAGPELLKVLRAIAKKLGKYPHAKLSRGGKKKQTTRMMLCECPACGCKVRMTRKWLNEAGAPTCGCGIEMEQD